MRVVVFGGCFALGLIWLACSSDPGEEDDNGKSSGGATGFSATACTEKNPGVICECRETDKPNDAGCPSKDMLQFRDGSARPDPKPVCCADETTKNCGCQLAGCEDTPGQSCTCSGGVFAPNIGSCKKPPNGVCCLNRSKSACTCLAQGRCPAENTPVESCSLGAVPSPCGPLKQVGSCHTIP